MKRTINSEIVEGRLYQHNLELKTVQNKNSDNYGKEFITGTLDVATDEAGLNIISVHFTYVVEKTKSGKTNVTFGVLKNIIDGAKAWITDGKDAALKVRVSTALALNDFYTREGELVSVKRNEGGFVNVIKDLAPEEERSTFKTDMVITSVNRVEADEEKNIDKDFLRIRGAIFNFRNDLLPVEFTCRNEKAFGYFEGLDVSGANPVFTEVRGNIVSNTVKQTIEEESAFGTASVRTVSRNVKEWVITWARPTEYDFGAEDVLTTEELKKAMQDREVYLADIKKRAEEFRASQTAGAAPQQDSAIPEGGFDF